MVSIKTAKGEKFYMYRNWDNKFPCMISTFKAHTCLSMGCELLLAYVLDGNKGNDKIKEVKVVNEFPKVFPGDLSDLPHIRQFEFVIDLVPGINPVARALYRLDPT